MKLVMFIFLVFELCNTQFNISSLPKLPSITYSKGLESSAIRKNSTEVYASIQEVSTKKIIKINTTDGSRLGEYKASQLYPYMYFFKDYILGSSNSGSSNDVFNLTSYAYLGSLSMTQNIGRGEFFQSKNIFFFGTTVGNVGYFSIDTLPTIKPIYLFNESIYSSFVFTQKSLDEKYISVSFMNTSYILIYQTSDFTLVKNISVIGDISYSQSWSGDNRYLMVFLYNQFFVLVYDRDTNWSLVKNFTIGYRNIRTSFYYLETNIVVAFSEGKSSGIILINWYDFSSTFYFSISGFKMYQSDSKQSLTIFDPTNGNASFFKINPFCTGSTFYQQSTKTCVSCSTNCVSCNSSTFCLKCATNFAVVNGTCQPCGNGTFYNSSTFMCDNCSAYCISCSSSSICTVCAANATLTSAYCILSPILINKSDFKWDSLILNCTKNCLTCTSISTCQVCVSGYNLLSKGACEVCPSQTFYNSTTKVCETCSQNCSVCSSVFFCTSCANGTFLFNGTCISCSIGNAFNEKNQSCYPNCTENCSVCDTKTTCQTCFAGYTKSAEGTCFTCSANCLQCSSPSICKQCKQNFSDQNGNCIPEENAIDKLEEQSAISAFYVNTIEIALDNKPISGLNKIPGSRRVVRQVFGFFMNIDHLWLYIYHQRQYGSYVDTLLKSVKKMEDEKWGSISTQVFHDTFGIDMNEIRTEINFKVNYTSKKYVEIEKQSSSFLQNTVDYFLVNVPMVFGTFLVFKMLFYLLFKFEVSLLFREYAFNGYLLIMLVEGNSESFTYMFTYDLTQLTSTSFKQNFFNVLTILLFVIFIAQLFAGILIVKSSYDNNAKYFFGNCSNSLTGCFHIFIENSFLNFGLGSVHLLVQNFYLYQLLMLFLLETLYISVTLFMIRKPYVFEFKYPELQNILASFLRILLIFTFYIDRNFPGQYEAIQDCQMCLLTIFLFNWIFSTFMSLLLMGRNLAKFIKRSFQIKKEVSSNHEHLDLNRFVNFSRRQIQTQKIKIEYIDAKSHTGNSSNRMKFGYTVYDTKKNTQLLLINKIQLQKAKKNIINVTKNSDLSNQVSKHPKFTPKDTKKAAIFQNHISNEYPIKISNYQNQSLSSSKAHNNSMLPITQYKNIQKSKFREEQSKSSVLRSKLRLKTQNEYQKKATYLKKKTLRQMRSFSKLNILTYDLASNDPFV